MHDHIRLQKLYGTAGLAVVSEVELYKLNSTLEGSENRLNLANWGDKIV